jgi:PAS domain S-box-containing protein
MSEDAPDPGAAGASVVVPDGGLAEALRADQSLTVVECPTPEAMRERVAAGDIEGVVHRHDPGTENPFAAAAGEAATGLPVVRVVPDGTAAAPADPDERTVHVREVGDWPAAVADRLGRLTTETPYRELYHAADEGLLLHPGETAEVVATSDRLHEMLGYEPGDDLNLEQIIAGEQADFSREEAAAMVRRTLREGEQTFEWLDERRDGTEVWVAVTLRPVEIRGTEQVVATIRDIDEQKAHEREAAAAEAEAEQAESRREATLGRVSDAFFGLDDDWRLTYVNERAADLIDVDPKTVRGESLWEMFPEANGSQFEYEYRAAMLTQEPVSFEAHYPPLEAWFEVNAYPSPDGLSVYFHDVTERKRREAELEAYEQLAENVEDALFVLDEAGRFELVTEPLAEWLGRDRAATEGEPATAVLAPDDDAVAAIRAAASEGRVASFETELVDPPDRRTGIVELSPLPSGAVGSLRDVTAERARQRSHDALIDNVPGMVYRRSVEPAAVADGVGEMAGPDIGGPVAPRMTFASEAAAEVAEREPERLAEGGTDWLADVVHPTDRASLVEQLRTAAGEGEPFTLRYRVVTPSGTKWVHDHGRPVTGPEGRVTSVEGFVVDVTARTQRERHRRVMMRVLRHNLRNSVQVISGFAQEIADRAADIDTDADVESLAETIDSRASKLAELSATARDVDDAVAAATDATGQIDAAALGRAVAAERRERHPDADVVTDLPETLLVQGDSTLKRAIDALVENAVVHNDGTATVRLSAVDPGREGWVGLEISDDGPGIPEREQTVLTDDGEITQLVHGRGLGLWLAKWLAESHGGELRIHDRDEGATVALLLPRVD